jgi:hypothetical protein
VADKIGLFRDPGVSERAVQDQYQELPASIRAIYSQLEYAWLSDAEKADLIRYCTEPEC